MRYFAVPCLVWKVTSLVGRAWSDSCAARSRGISPKAQVGFLGEAGGCLEGTQQFCKKHPQFRSVPGLHCPQSNRHSTAPHPPRHRYRDLHRISSAEHQERLKEHNWTQEDFLAGFQEEVSREQVNEVSEKFLKYQAMVKETLATGEVSNEKEQSHA